MVSVTMLERGREFTQDDLESMPDDGRRYELIDGSLIVTPAPGRRTSARPSRSQRSLTVAALQGWRS